MYVYLGLEPIGRWVRYTSYYRVVASQRVVSGARYIESAMRAMLRVLQVGNRSVDTTDYGV